tara:strand:+ start:81 stop:554 length:474 start_codon:yes stop_codon:yes gene_type:complete
MIKLKDILLEIAATGGEGGVVATYKPAQKFKGKDGVEMEGLFQGPMQPAYGELKDLLQKQLDDRFEKEAYSDKISEPYKTSYEVVYDDYKFDDSSYLTGKENEKFKTKGDKDQEVDLNIKYDNKITDLIDKDIFINDTDDYKEIKYSDVVNKWGAKI